MGWCGGRTGVTILFKEWAVNSTGGEYSGWGLGWWGVEGEQMSQVYLKNGQLIQQEVSNWGGGHSNMKVTYILE